MEVVLHDSTYCRLCAEENPSGVSLYSNDEADLELSSLVNRYLPMKIQDDGKLPRTICPGCNIQLQATVQFFDLLVEGQKKIRQLWLSQSNKIRRLEKERLRVMDESLLKIPQDAESMVTNGALEETRDVFIQILEDGTMFTTEHEMTLKMEGLEKPKRKRGRPKRVVEPVEEQTTLKPEESGEPELLQDQIEEAEEDVDGRRRRKRKVPQRFMEAVQGKELEKIFREEGVIDEDEPEEEIGEDVDDKGSRGEQDMQEEIIGHLETSEGKDLGELVIVNRNRSRGRPRGKRRKIRYECDICGRGFQQKGRYILHKSYHKGVKFECEECKMRFTSRDHLDLHQKNSGHTGEGILEGMEDGQDGGNLTSKYRFPCTACDKVFRTKQSYEVHYKAIHEGVRPFSCEECGKTFAYQNSLKCHQVAAHELQDTKTEKGFPCDICGKLLNHPSSIIYHKEAEHNNGRRFVCNKCGKSFKHKQLLQRHQLVHSDDRPFICKVCGAGFKTNANLMNHQPTHTGEKKYFCELCGQQFAHKTSLTLHYRWHTGHRPYQCNVCNKTFTQNGNLQEHVRIHTGEKPFCCDFCGRKFTTSSQFKLHVKRHTGERPWKCEFCGKSFLHKDTWKCHTRRHKGERPFQCQYCTRGFTEQWALKKHVRLHTGEKPYSCNICNKAFADCSNLTKHKKVHREDKDGGVDSNLGVNGNVWNIIRSHLSKDMGEGTEGGDGDGVQQIIYVTYQDPDDPDTKTLHIVNDMPSDDKLKTEEGDAVMVAENGAAVESLVVAPDEESLDMGELPQPESLQLPSQHSLQVTDEEGNSIHFTMQDGRELQITTSDGQSLQVTTVDGQTIPLQLTTPDGQPITPDMACQFQNVAVAATESLVSDLEAEEAEAIVGLSEEDMNHHLVKEEQHLEFTTQDGQKVHLVTSYDVDVEQLRLPSEYLTTT